MSDQAILSDEAKLIKRITADLDTRDVCGAVLATDVHVPAGVTNGIYRLSHSRIRAVAWPFRIPSTVFQPH